MFGNLRKWIDNLGENLLSSGSARPSRQRRGAANRCRSMKPTLEVLEDRLTPAPVITSVVVNGDISLQFNAPGQPNPGVQRSMVEDVVYTFSEPVTMPPTGVFTIAVASGWTGTVPAIVEEGPAATMGPYNPNLATPNPLYGANSYYSWEVDFGANSGNLSAGPYVSIANGCYTISVDQTQITGYTSGQQLSVTSGLAPGPGNPNYQTQAFFRLYGDINGDGVVNALDNLQIKKALMTYNPAFDYNESGVVNSVDNLHFKQDLTVSYVGFTPTI